MSKKRKGLISLIELKCKRSWDIKWFAQEQNIFQKFLFMFYFVIMWTKAWSETFSQANNFVPLIQFYNQSRKRKKVLQHLQSESKKRKIDVKSMFHSNFTQKSSICLKQPIGKNIARFSTKMSHPVSSKQSYDSACSHTPQQIVTCNTNSMSTSLANVFGKRAVDPPSFSRTLKKKKKKKKKSNFFSKFKDIFFYVVKYQFSSFIKLSQKRKM